MQEYIFFFVTTNFSVTTSIFSIPRCIIDNSLPTDVVSDKDAGLGNVYSVIAGNNCILNVLRFLIIF